MAAVDAAPVADLLGPSAVDQSASVNLDAQNAEPSASESTVIAGSAPASVPTSPPTNAENDDDINKDQATNNKVNDTAAEKALPVAPSTEPADTPDAPDAVETMSESPSASASEWEKVEKPTSPIKPAGSQAGAGAGAGLANKLESPFRRRESEKQNGGRERKEESPIGRKVGEVRRVLKEGMFGGESPIVTAFKGLRGVMGVVTRGPGHAQNARG